MALQLPAPGQPDETMRVALEGVRYVLRWFWNARDDHYALDITTEGGTAIASGLRVVTGWNLLAGVSAVERPPGALIVVDGTESTSGLGDRDPKLGTLGDAHRVIYLTAAEVAELGAS